MKQHAFFFAFFFTFP
ncbi:pheA operon leader peptide PheL [Cronobacter sakazakii]|uniref:PheA operon leader peptide PheL n=1 Tax=Cronobacter turicensis TaxID=413502 RepID=A0ACD5IY72_9ENTR|nr:MULTISPECIES: pheA operon leader peptide PheL [Cronobacter]EHS4535473.1 pheA operon leader peptide PheL [Cronobacter sakazakii]EHS4644869.1 pheA operon leader peptide PheL [Cronobacter sakazakii]EIV2971643.1 pheA operon leader peptide PheL [Cronobacter sakazakii]EIX1500842.1 pheA operon leader peptide PheL [Cronobacter sakazakii]EIX1505656.1 pheA operon leader peptide PheL [Cronobacter sakazakii]